MGTMITFKRPDGKEAPGYEAKPVGVDAAPGIVLIQEWWGINDQISKVGDRFVREGYRVVIPDLFRGRVTLDEAEAAHLMRSLDFGDAAAQDVRGAVMHLKAEGCRKAGITGFCMGGALTVLAAVRAVEGDAAVSFYGYPPPEAADTTTIRMPLMGHFARDDEFFPIAGVDDLEQRLKVGKVDYQFYRYDARHAFCNEERPNYEPAAARIAWHRTTRFFNKHLKR